MFTFFTLIHVLNVVFWICVMCFYNWNESTAWVYFLRSPEKGVSWKSWLYPRFPRNPKLKQILKWLPLDTGRFKVYFFYEKRKYTNNLMLYVFIESQICRLISSHVRIAMHFVLMLNCPVIHYYWLMILRKEMTWKLWYDPWFLCHPK